MNNYLVKLLSTFVDKNSEVLDIGCGNKEYSSTLKCKRLVTLDAWDKTNPDILIDLEISDIPAEPHSFDVILMLDFIEHLSKERGGEILDQAKNITRDKILLFTPLWWSDNSDNVNCSDLWCYGNQYDFHKSLWTLKDFTGWHRITPEDRELDNYFLGYWQKERTYEN